MSFTYLPQPYPTCPTIGSIPASPELVVPALLGVVVVVEAFGERLSTASASFGLLGGVTFPLGAASFLCTLRR